MYVKVVGRNLAGLRNIGLAYTRARDGRTCATTTVGVIIGEFSPVFVVDYGLGGVRACNSPPNVQVSDTGRGDGCREA